MKNLLKMFSLNKNDSIIIITKLIKKLNHLEPNWQTYFDKKQETFHGDFKYTRFM